MQTIRRKISSKCKTTISLKNPNKFNIKNNSRKNLISEIWQKGGQTIIKIAQPHPKDLIRLKWWNKYILSSIRLTIQKRTSFPPQEWYKKYAKSWNEQYIVLILQNVKFIEFSIIPQKNEKFKSLHLKRKVTSLEKE